MRKAVRLSRTEKLGAVHIEVPEDVAKMDAGTEPMEPRRYLRSVPEQSLVDRAYGLLERAERPVILAGNGRIDGMPFAGLRESGLGTGGIPYTMRDMQTEKMLVIKSPEL